LSFYSILGSKRFEFSSDDAARVLNICSALSIVCENQLFSDDSFLCDIPFLSCPAAEKAFSDTCIVYSVVSSRGTFPFLLKYKKRCGIPIGFILLVSLCLFSSSFLWNIEVIGADTVSRSDMTETLKNAGLYLGCYIPSLDVDKIESASLVGDKRLSWISVNINGNTAYVEIRERIEGPSSGRELPYANIVATEDAIVTDMEIFSGVPAVKRDTYVRKGELLISGIIDKEALGTHFTYAGGHVFGKSFKDLKIEVPFVYSVLEETGNKKYGVRMNFFSNLLSIPPLGGFYENFSEYTTVYAVKEGTRSLPVYFETIEYRESDFVCRTRNEDEAKQKAFEDLNFILSTEFSDAEILSKKYRFLTTDSGVTMECEIWYEREIGHTVEFEAEQ